MWYNFQSSNLIIDNRPGEIIWYFQFGGRNCLLSTKYFLNILKITTRLPNYVQNKPELSTLQGSYCRYTDGETKDFETTEFESKDFESTEFESRGKWYHRFWTHRIWYHRQKIPQNLIPQILNPKNLIPQILNPEEPDTTEFDPRRN